MPKTAKECEEHYQELRTKSRRNYADRIFIYLYHFCSDLRWGKSWHEICDGYFFVREGQRTLALDGGRPIPWQSMGSAMKNLRKEGWIVESKWKYPDPITRNDACRVYAASVPEDWWNNQPPKTMF